MSLLSKSSEPVSKTIGTSMVASNSGLSLFDKPLDRQNRDVVCTYLNELPHKIVAVWIVARPISGLDVYKFEHWCVKIQSPTSLISIDFIESDGRGKFGLCVTTAMEAELQDFLMYYVQHPQLGRLRKKWRVVSSVTPSPLINHNYRPDFLDPHELSTLKKYMKSLKKKSKNPNSKQLKLDDGMILKKIKTNKKVCDIADFLEMWTEYQDKNKRNYKDKPYNPVSHNCQQFAVHLFKYLIGAYYPDKVVAASKQTQSPADIKAYKIESKKNENVDKNLQKKINVNDNCDNLSNIANNGALLEGNEPSDEDEEKTQ